MPTPTALVIANAKQFAAWEQALRARGLEPFHAGKKGGERPAPSVVVVSEKLPFAGALRVTKDLRKDPATRELPVVLVGAHPFTNSQRLRLGDSAPDATVPPGASPEELAAVVEQALKAGRLPPVELTPSQKQGMRYSRTGTILMVFGVFLSFPSLRPTAGEAVDPWRAWCILLIPLGGLVSDISSGRVDGRKRLLSWQGWAAVAIMVGITLGLLFWPGFQRWAGR